MKALREQSTHYEAQTRITVYERLGLNKPGFWVDNQQRRLEQEENDAGYDTTPQWRPPMLDYESQWVDYGSKEPAAKRTINPFAGPQPAPAAGGGRKTIGPDLAGNLKNQSNQWFANNRMATSGGRSIGVMDVSAAQRAVQMSEISAMLQSKNQSLLSFEGLNSVSQYHVMKATERAEARLTTPFGQGLPTSFDQMQAALAKKKQNIKGNTKGISVLNTAQTSAKQGITMGTSKVIKGPGTPQLNVHANGYASNYPYPNFS